MRALSRNSQLATRRGLTLIELLVTIVIMVTVLAGVIPLMSPNNNARKIREASRQLSSMLAQAQAQAARDGRPAGVALVEFGTSSPYSGMALEAYVIAEPRPFAGFSDSSRVVIGNSVGIYGPEVADGQNGGTQFLKYYGYDVYPLSFSLGIPGSTDQLPPDTFQFGDTVEVDGYHFMVVDDNKPQDVPNKLMNPSNPQSKLEAAAEWQCVWTNARPGQLLPQGLRMYQIRRLPANTSDAPLQFPRGIGVDLQASAAPGPDGLNDLDSNGKTTIRIMFDSNGSLSALYGGDRQPRQSINQVFFLVGAFENGNNGDPEYHSNYDFVANQVTPGDKDALAQRRGRVNWLNADNRWVAVNRSGRVVTSTNNTSFDPSSTDFLADIVSRPANERQEAQFNKQREFARLYAAQMQTEGGR